MKKIPFKGFRHALTLPAVKLVILTAAVTPRAVSRLYATFLGWLLSILPLPSNRIIRKHQKGVITENGITVRASAVYTGVLSGYFDFFYLSRRSDETFRDLIEVQGAENMEKALSFGKGVIAVTAHLGPWELLPRAMKLMGFDIGVVGRALSQSGTSDILDKLRQKPGVETIDRGAGVAPIMRLLRSNKTLGMLIDQDTKGVQSQFAGFLGRPAWTPVAPAVLATRLQAPVVTLHITRRKDSTFLLVIDEPVFFTGGETSEGILTFLNDRISRWILDTPEQWVWFHNRWRRQP